MLQSQVLKTLLNLLETDLALHQRFPKLHNPVEPDLALQQASQTFSGTFTFSGTLLNLTWPCTNLTRLCTKASQNPVEPDLVLQQNLPNLLRNLLRNPVEPDFQNIGAVI